MVVRPVPLSCSVLINGQKVDRPSCHVRVGDQVTVKSRFKEKVSVKKSIEQASKRPALSWIEFMPETATGRLLSMPGRADIPVELNEQLIVELYSK